MRGYLNNRSDYTVDTIPRYLRRFVPNAHLESFTYFPENYEFEEVFANDYWQVIFYFNVDGRLTQYCVYPLGVAILNGMAINTIIYNEGKRTILRDIYVPLEENYLLFCNRHPELFNHLNYIYC